jgi:stage III sporulation protein AF
MGLMEGLSNWLRQIIAVVLLASLIDLLLPNRTMQRYVRLVAGLFILMTVATPILHWMKGDFSSKLADGLSAVELKPDSADQQMAMIEEEGAKLRDKHGAQAANLVSTKLAAAIRSEVEQSEQREVRKVDVELIFASKWKIGRWSRVRRANNPSWRSRRKWRPTGKRACAYPHWLQANSAFRQIS